jgi:hypothetical protein
LQVVDYQGCGFSDCRRWAKAVCILGYLRDERVAEHLNGRLQSNNGLYDYENHALWAVGSKRAAEVFVLSANVAAARIESSRGTKEEETESRLWYHITIGTADLRHLTTDFFETAVMSLIDSQNRMASRFGLALGNSSRSIPVIRHIIFSGRKWGYPGLDFDISKAIPASEWLNWWAEASSNTVRASLLHVLGNIPDVRIEDIAMDCLSVPELLGSAANALERVGTTRCLPYLRKSLSSLDMTAANLLYPMHGLLLASGTLRDSEATDDLERVGLANPCHLRDFALDALAKIGTGGAAEALLRLSGAIQCDEPGNKCVIESLVAHASLETVNRAIEIAEQHSDGPKWLVRKLAHVFMIRGQTIGEYYTHVQDSNLVKYLFSAEKDMTGEERSDLIKSFEQIDSENVRSMLWDFARRAGTNEDVNVVILKNRNGPLLSSLALRELINRGDKGTISTVVVSILNCKSGIFSSRIDELAKFQSSLVVSEIKTRLNASSKSTDELVRLLSILGTYGTSLDAPDAGLYSNVGDETVQNVTDETTKLLLDPLRLAEGWREMFFTR